MPSLPSGTVTFLLTDIEDSSMQWERDPDGMRHALTIHDALIAERVDANGGAVVKHMGDGCWAAFGSAPHAAEAAIGFRRDLADQSDDIQALLRVRIGLHTGEVEPTEDDYFGPVPNRSARVAGLANGNQIVCSSSTAGLLVGRDLHSEGLHQLKGIGPEEIFQLRAEGLVVDPRPLRLPVTTTNLPRRPTSFVGRDADLEHVLAVLDAGHAVVTLAGPGGVGKTRLALEAGSRLVEGGSEAVLFVDLTAVSDTDGFASTVAEVIGARRQPGMDVVGSIVDYLHDRSLVLILDNAEHVIGDVRDLVRRLAALDDVLTIVTSREALRIPGEQLVTVEPLDVRDAGVELFVARARERDEGFAPDADDLAATREIVARLDGIPLAIELAAARIRLMTPSEMAERLDDRFALLGGGRDRDRHQTLHAAVAWSFKLLTPAEAALFSRLSVFNGGFTLESAEAVCADDDIIDPGEVGDLVLSLVDKSMIDRAARNGRTRFRLLETLRTFGQGVLDADGTAELRRRRHADHFGRLAAEQNTRLFTGAEPDAWRVLDAEWANMRIAVETFQRTGDVDGAAEIVVSLVWFAALSMRYELFDWASEILAVPGIEEHRRVTDLQGAVALGAYFTVSGDPTELAEVGLAADPTDREGFCRTALAAVLLNNLHTPEASDTLTSEWLASGPTTIGSRLWAEAFRTFHLCTHEPSPEAARHAAAVQRIAASTGSATAKAMAAWAQGQVVSFTDLDRAIEIWTEGLEWPRAMPSDHLAEHLLTGLLLHVTVRRGDLEGVVDQCRRALQAAVDSHYYVGSSHLFGVTSIALCRAGDAPTAARLVGAMIGNGHIPRSNALRALDEALGDDVDDLVAPGLSMSITQASQMALDALTDATTRIGADAP